MTFVKNFFAMLLVIVAILVFVVGGSFGVAYIVMWNPLAAIAIGVVGMAGILAAVNTWGWE